MDGWDGIGGRRQRHCRRRLGATTATFAPGRALEFVATFSGASFQNAGLGQTLDSGSESWAMFGTDGTANLLRVRVNNAGTTSQFDLGSTYLNAPHRYRIEWDAAQIRFLVDGTLVHTENVTIGANLRPIASDFNNGGGALVLDWMRLGPYPGSGAFISRVLDGGSNADWQQLTSTLDLPPGTAVASRPARARAPTLTALGRTGARSRAARSKAATRATCSTARPSRRATPR